MRCHKRLHFPPRSHKSWLPRDSQCRSQQCDRTAKATAGCPVFAQQGQVAGQLVPVYISTYRNWPVFQENWGRCYKQQIGWGACPSSIHPTTCLHCSSSFISLTGKGMEQKSGSLECLTLSHHLLHTSSFRLEVFWISFYSPDSGWSRSCDITS